MSIIEFSSPSRNTKAHKVSVCGVYVYFSYDTPVACNPPGSPSFQRENVWGPTTGRHLNAWGFNRLGIDKVDEDEFERRLSLAIFKAMADRMTQRLGA